jgi:hypothetical protein
MKNHIPEAELEKIIQVSEYDAKVLNELKEKGEINSYSYHPKMKEIHDNNIRILEDFINRYGWPIPSVHGKKAFEAAWFISIHAIGHPEQMIRTRDKMKELLDQGEDVSYQYASLYDRIALFIGGKQKYGTQFWPSKYGWFLKSCDSSEEEIDREGLVIGLAPFKERKSEMTDFYEGGLVSADEEERQDREFNIWLQETGWDKY